MFKFRLKTSKSKNGENWLYNYSLDSCFCVKRARSKRYSA